MSALYALPDNVSFFEAMIADMSQRLALQLGLQYSAKPDPGEGFSLIPIEGSTDGSTAAVRIYVREQDKHRNDCAPSVCCVPLGGDIVPPNTIGEQRTTLPSGKTISVQAIRDRLFRTRVYLWGESRGQAETLLGQTILAFEGFHNMVEFSEETWEDQQDNAGGPATYGALISYLVTIRLMVSTLPTRLVKVLRVTANVSQLDQTTRITIP